MINTLKEATKYAVTYDAQLLLIPQGIEVVMTREINLEPLTRRKIITWEGISDSMCNLVILSIDQALDNFKKLETEGK